MCETFGDKMIHCPFCQRPARETGKCDYNCKRSENKSHVREERTPSLPSLDLDISQSAGAVSSACARRLHTPKQQWEKLESPPLPKIEDCTQPLRRRLEQELAAQIEKSKRKHERDSLPDWWIKILIKVAWQMVMTSKAERSQAHRVRFCRQAANRGVMKRRQEGTLHSHMAWMRTVKKGWSDMRKSGAEGEKIYQEWRHGEDQREAWQVWQKPPEPLRNEPGE